MQQQTCEQGLENVVFLGRQDKHLVPALLSATDTCLVHLKKSPLFETVLPSKLFEAAAMAKPIVLGVEGYAAALVKRAQAGICIEPENAQQLAEALEKLAENPELCRNLGRTGREHVMQHFDRNKLARDYLDLIVAKCKPSIVFVEQRQQKTPDVEYVHA